MVISEKGLKKLHEREGLRLKPYLDTRGVPTIAMGNTNYLDGRAVTMKDKALTIEQAQQLGEITAKKFALGVNSLVSKEVNQNQFDALVSLAYNIGLGGFKNSTLLKRVNANPNDPIIKDAFMMWSKNKELIGRRESEIKQYFSK